MEKVILIRHAKVVIEPTVPSEDWKLSEDALHACQTLAAELENEGLERIITSNLSRAFETGRIIAEHLQLPYETAANLQEHDRTGVPFMGEEKWMTTLQAFFKTPDALVFGQETANQALTRFETGLNQVLERYPNQRLGIASHGTVMSLFIANYNDIDVIEFWQRLKMPQAIHLSLPDFELI